MSNEKQYTPGPWKVVESGERLYIQGNDARVARDIAAVYRPARRETADADARLITASPDLAEAADALARELEHWIEWKNGNAMPPQREKGRDALRLYREAKAKATGG